MNDFETRTRNVKLFLALALAGFLMTFIYPATIDSSDFSIFSMSDLIDDIETMLVIPLLGTVIWVVSFILMANQFVEDEYGFDRSDCRGIGLWMIPIAAIFFILFMAISSSHNIFQDLIKGFVEIFKEIGLYMILGLFALSFMMIGRKICSITGPKNFNIAGYGFYGMSAVFIIALLAILYVFSANSFSAFKHLDFIADVTKIISLLSVIAVVIGFLIALFSPINRLGSEESPEEGNSYRAEPTPEQTDRWSAASQSSVVESSRSSYAARSYSAPAYSAPEPPAVPVTEYSEPEPAAPMYPTTGYSDETPAGSSHPVESYPDAELIKMIQQPQLHSYADLEAATTTLYNRSTPFYIDGFRALTDEQLRDILTDTTSYYPADVRAAAEEKRRRYMRT